MTQPAAMCLYAPATGDIEFVNELGAPLEELARQMRRSARAVTLMLARTKPGDPTADATTADVISPNFKGSR